MSRWLFLVATLCSGCATLNPVTGRLQFVAMSERQEERLGKRMLEQMRQSPGVIEGTPLTDYAQEVGSGVAAVAAPRSFSYRFFVLDSPEANAFALPGGTVLITRGLLAMCTEEDEIASVLGHEIGHILARHAAARAAVALPADLITRAIATAVGVFNAEQSQRVRDKLPGMLVAPYTRGQEREADRVGAVLAASLGYDPAALGRILERMEAVPRPGLDIAGFASHPPTPERVEIIDILSESLERGPLTPIRTDFIELLDGMLLGPSLRVGRVRGTTLIVPHDRLVLEYPEDWVHQITPDGHVAVAPGGAVVVSMRVLTDDDAIDELEPLEPIESKGGHTVERSWFAVPGKPPGISRLYRFDHAGTHYQLVTTFATAEQETWVPVLDGIATSAHQATAAQLAWLSVIRLRLVTAAPGETPTQLAARTASIWDGDEVAMANGLEVDEPLTGGERVKIALREALAPKHRQVALP